MPTTTTLVATRRAMSEIVLGQLSQAITEWLKDCEDRDRRRQHATQLAAIRDLLTRGLTRLERDFKALPRDGDAGEFFAAARSLETRIVWFDRLWRFFEAKFAQRADQSPFKTVLLLADEMVWSCYSQVFDRARARRLPIAEQAAPPLPFVDPRYSPAAFPSQLVPADFKGRDAPEWLGDFLNRMPVSVVRIPPSSAAAPWSLTLLAHEVGHHIQYDLLPDKKLVALFEVAVEQGVAQTDAFPDAKTWAGWSVEIFADMFSAVCIGPWAVRAIFELEFTKADAVDAHRDGYPPPAIRLALLAAAVDRVTQSTRGTEELKGLIAVDASDPAQRAVLDVALGPLPEVGASLSELCDTGDDGFASDIASWSETLRGADERVPDRSLRSARILVSATYDAWHTIAPISAGQPLETARRRLCERAAKAILLGSPEGERGAEEPIVDAALADAVVDTIWKETA